MNTCSLKYDEQLFAVMAKAAYAATTSLKLQVLIDQYGTTGDWTIDETLSSQETTVFVHSPTRSVVTAFRGSKSVLDWVVTDVILAIGHLKYSPRFRSTQQEFERVLKKYPQWTHYVTGHSLGGALSSKIGLTYSNVQAYSFNQGSGLKDINRSTADNVNQYFVNNDFLSFLGQNQSATVIQQNAANAHTLDNFICNSVNAPVIQGIHPDKYALYLNKVSA